MFNKILIANRGEIACRVIKTARKLGVHTVAVYSDADTNALHVEQADEAIHIGASPSSASYLCGDKVIAAAHATGATAIHPGYGFLSENSEFAQQCADNNLVFIGPPASAIESMGSKSAAKTIMEKASVPLVPGYHGADQNPSLLKQAADEMGYPVLLKAVAGGGGKGMRQVWSEDEFDTGLAEAKREALTSFGNDDMLVEKFLTQPRHVEIQVFCDNHGNGVYLFERDCSIQRRHQKIIEEAPAPNMSDELRIKMGEAAVTAAKAINYVGAGTVEFLLDVDGSFYFMEMNTRLQVEHPVTEMITGEDLVEWQLRVADGEPLPKQQNELSFHGHAFEARVYAEDPNNDFLPTTGTLTTLNTPNEDTHIRIDTGVLEGDQVSPFYDPMIAKLIVWDIDRAAALARTAKALREYQINGVTTNLTFLYDLATNPAFIGADLDTGFIEKQRDVLFSKRSIDLTNHLALAALYLTLNLNNNQNDDPWENHAAWRMNSPNQITYQFTLSSDEDAQQYPVTVHQNPSLTIHIIEQTTHKTITASGKLQSQELIATLNGHRQKINVAQNGDEITLFSEHGSQRFIRKHPSLGFDNKDLDGSNFAAPMNGTIIDVLVKAGEQVDAGQALVVMEAMKMQHTIKAPCSGSVQELFCSQNDLVDGGAILLEFAADD